MSATVSANEPAHRFGLSEKTVRRWIKSGKLKADKSGRAYRVMLSEVEAIVTVGTAPDRGPLADTVRTADIHSAPSTADSRSAMSGIAELVALVDRLQAEARQHAETSAMWQERAGTLADRLAVAEQKLLALEAPKSTLTSSTGLQITETTTGASIPRWRALSPWLLAVLAIVVVVALLTVPR